MAKLSFIFHTLVLHTQPPLKLPIFFYIINLVLHSFFLPSTYTKPITPTNTEISHQTTQILQILWFLTMIVKNNII